MKAEIKRLTELKDRIKETKQQKAKLEGKMQALFEQLDDQYECKTIKQATELKESMEVEVDTLEKEVKEGLDELESKYDW